MEKRGPALYWRLFSSTFLLSAFTFGGGYVIVPLMKQRFVDNLGWLEEQEMLDLTAIAQSAPGPIAVNAAILVGYRVAGLAGAAVAILGTVLPPLIILSILSLFYSAFKSNPVVAAVLRGMQSGVAAVIASVVVDMAGNILRQRDWLATVIMVASFAVTWFFGVNVIWIILACAAIGILATLLRLRSPGGEEGTGMIYLQLFWSFFQVGLFSFGGGYAALPLIQAQVVDGHGWLTMSEFTDLITISQMTPGPIAINSATFVGTQIAGLPGAVIATAGCVFPSCIIVSLLAFLYYRYQKLTAIQGALYGLRPAVVALIASAGLSILITAFWGEGGFVPMVPDLAAVGLFFIGFVVLRKWKPDPVWVMLGAGVLGALLYLLFPGLVG